MEVAEIVTESFERLQFFGEEVSGDMFNSALRSMRFLLLDWCGDKSKQWSIDTDQLSLVQGVQSYALDGRTFDVFTITLNENNTDIPINALSREEWDILSQKNTSGKPAQYFIDRSVVPVVLKVWPIPNQNGLTLNYTRIKYPSDFLNPSSPTEVTPHWSNALASGLASYLSLKFKPELKQTLDMDATLAYRKASRGDSSSTDFIARPYRRRF